MDSQALRYLLQYAAACRDRDGCFDPEMHLFAPERHLVDEQIYRWVSTRFTGDTPKSRATAWRAIQRVIDRPNKPWELVQRTKTGRPYTRSQRQAFENAATSIAPTYWGPPWRALLDLTFGCGLRPAEIIRVRGTDVRVHRRHVAIVAANTKGVAREVPVFDEAVAARLAAHADSDDYILRTRREQRDRIVHDITNHTPKHTGSFIKWDNTRARNTWLADLLIRPLPFADIAFIADINAGSSVVADITSMLPASDPTTVAARLHRMAANLDQDNLS